MKFRHLIDYNKTNISLQESYRKCGRKTSLRPLFIFQKVLYELKAIC